MATRWIVLKVPDCGRPAGESRLSGFLLWQAAYSEYSFVDVYWPAFRRVDFLRELRHYTQRERRFGQ